VESNTIVREDLERIVNGLSEHEVSFFDGSEILVTGASGFIGFYIFKFLSNFRDELGIKKVTALDNFLLGTPRWIDQVQKADENIRFYQFDISKDNLHSINRTAKCNLVIHMASIASPSYYRRYPLNTLDANVWGLRNLLDFYSNKNLDGFLNFSSSEVYGDPDPSHIPTDEDYKGNVSFNGPRACYDEAKRFSETLAYVFMKEFGMKITSVRPFNNYGPGMRYEDKRVPSDFARAVVENRPIEVLSNGTPKRTFCYISDAVTGYLKAASFGKFDFFNIGMDRPEITIDELAEIFMKEGKRILGYERPIVYSRSLDKEYLSDNPQRRCPDIRKARNLLNFRPKIEVKEGVARYLLYLKEDVKA
jgi:UDP-glucuronate decarboxylase